jgi:hypothetical protein
MSVPTNIGYGEFYRIHGYLPGDAIENLCDIADSTTELSSPDSFDIDAGFIEEDFLDQELKELEAAIKMCGRSKYASELTGALKDIREKVEEAKRNAEYGADELRKAAQSFQDVGL